LFNLLKVKIILLSYKLTFLKIDYFEYGDSP